MSRRLKLIVAYDGAPFAGWQSQKHGNTIQDHLEGAFERVSGERVRVHGAGRTDAGVHALGQCAHVDLAEAKLNASDWTRALNAILPPHIRVLRSAFASGDFHARLSAKGKLYRYRIWTGVVLPPLEYGRAWHVARQLDAKRVVQCACLFKGTHDFRAFAANRGRPEPDTTRTLYSVNVRRAGRLLALEFDGDGFLYKMVRLMVGSIVDCGLGRMRAADMAGLLRSATPARRRIAAPADGLFLVRVRY